MLILAHAGITLGAALLLNRAFSKESGASTEQNINEGKTTAVSELDYAQSNSIHSHEKRLVALGKRVDIRLLILGSLLPDLIDKPIGIYIFGDTFNTGRIFCHTLLFFLLISIAGIYLYKNHHKTWLLILSFGTFMHLILDQMWVDPPTFFWPLLGFDFEAGDYTEWASSVWDRLFNNTAIYIAEIVGAVIIVWFVFTLLRAKSVQGFIRSGRVP